MDTIVAVEMKPEVWRPNVVETKEVFKNAVETWFNKLGAEMNPAVWYPY